MQTMMCRAGFLPDVAMMILLATVVVMNMCMLMGPTKGWSDTNEYHLLSQLQLPFAENIIAYVLRKCENLVGVMGFGHKAYNNILPWLRTHYSQKFLIQDMFLNHPQNIQWSYLLEHAQNFIETFRAIMNLLGVDIPPLEGVVQLRFLMTKKRTLDMMEFVEGFVNSEVLKAVQQRTEKVIMARMAIVEVMMKALNPKEAAKAAKRVEKEAAAVVAVAAAAAAIEKRNEMQAAAEVAALAAAAARAVVAVACAADWAMQAAAETSCVCSHVGCVKTKHARGVCRDHGPRCNHDGCKKNVYVGGACKLHHQLK
jgi:hypothetical protein